MMQGMISALFIDFDKIWWSICTGLLYIVDILEKSMNFIMGVDPIMMDGGESASANDLLSRIFGNLLWKV